MPEALRGVALGVVVSGPMVFETKNAKILTPRYGNKSAAYKGADKSTVLFMVLMFGQQAKFATMLPRTFILALIATPLLAAEPEKLGKLRASYEAAMIKATAPVQKTYTTELEKLKTELTKAGKLEDALAVAEGITKLTSEANPKSETSASPKTDGKHVSLSAKKAIEKRFVGKMWIETSNTGPGQQHFYFRQDGSVTRKVASRPPGQQLGTGTWRMEDDGLVLVMGIGGNIRWMSFDSDNAARHMSSRTSDAQLVGSYALVPDEADPGTEKK